MPEEIQELWAERAAIMVYDGQLQPAEATRRAWLRRRLGSPAGAPRSTAPRGLDRPRRRGERRAAGTPWGAGLGQGGCGRRGGQGGEAGDGRLGGGGGDESGGTIGGSGRTCSSHGDGPS